MNDRPPDPDLEAALSRLRPAAPPAEFLARLEAGLTPPPRREPAPRAVPFGSFGWRSLFRFAPFAALAAIVLAFAVHLPAPPPSASRLADAPPDDHLLIHREIRTTPAGPMVDHPDGTVTRLSRRNTVERIIMTDRAAGLIAVQITPRSRLVDLVIATN